MHKLELQAMLKAGRSTEIKRKLDVKVAAVQAAIGHTCSNAKRPCDGTGLTASLSEALKSETHELHRQAERSAFMGVLLSGNMKRGPYCAMLRNLHLVYATLEPALVRHAQHPSLAALHFPALARESALRRDLDELHGPGWQEAYKLQSATLIYADRLHSLDDSQPALLAAHSYVRYLGDLSGGQVLGRIVRDSLQLAPQTGTAFYNFGTSADVTDLKLAYREGLNSLHLDDQSHRAVVAEARFAFELHKQLFEELATGGSLS